jgi:hypothetical protein
MSRMVGAGSLLHQVCALELNISNMHVCMQGYIQFCLHQLAWRHVICSIVPGYPSAVLLYTSYGSYIYACIPAAHELDACPLLINVTHHQQASSQVPPCSAMRVPSFYSAWLGPLSPTWTQPTQVRVGAKRDRWLICP